MKKIIVILLATISLNALAQKQVVQEQEQTQEQTNSRDDGFVNLTYEPAEGANGWGLTGKACWGCPSFYYRILRTSKPDEYDKYYYYVQFYSNSYSTDGYLRPTTVYNIKIYIDGELNKTVEYAIVNINEVETVAILSNRDTGSWVEFTYTEKTVD